VPRQWRTWGNSKRATGFHLGQRTQRAGRSPWDFSTAKNKKLPETQTVQFEIWGQRGWHNFEVVGESPPAREIRALLPSRELGDGTELIVPVSLVHTPNNPHDRNAVEVRAATGLVGYLSREDAVRYAPAFAALQQNGRIASTTARVWGNDQENWDTGKKEFVSSIRIDLPEPHMLIPANHPPEGAHQILPVGSAIQVTGEENHMPAILQFLNSDGECWIHATLHQIVEEGPRANKTLAEVRIDGNTVGRLTPKMSSDLLPAVSYLAELGQTTCVRAIVKGNRLKAEVVLYTLRAHELPADWFSATTVAQGAPSATAGALRAAGPVDNGESEQSPRPSAADTPAPPPPPLPPADWYADPHHIARLRYWDGAKWTEHTAP